MEHEVHVQIHKVHKVHDVHTCMYVMYIMYIMYVRYIMYILMFVCTQGETIPHWTSVSLALCANSLKKVQFLSVIVSNSPRMSVLFALCFDL